jgi:HPt (histidine-containing phosphotransfer) domain-containing protein
LACGDAQNVVRSAHTLASSAGNVGAVAMQEAAHNLESAADEPDSDLTGFA